MLDTKHMEERAAAVEEEIRDLFRRWSESVKRDYLQTKMMKMI